MAFSSGGPDFTRVAGQAVKGVANISSLQVVRQPNSQFENDPFFQYFFGNQDAFGSRDRRSLRLGSGAGHDGQAMAKLCPIGMLFVRCRGGISHNPMEYANPQDLGLAVAALIGFIERFEPEKLG